MSRNISFPDFLRAVVIPMFGFAIVNPMGPTFMGFAIGKTKSGNASLLFFSLNPFNQTAEEIKTYNFDPHDVDQNSMLIEYGLCFDINEYLTIKKSNENEFATPTILFGTFDGESEGAINEQRLISLSIVRHSNDPIRTLNNLNQFPMNVTDRVSHEISMSPLGLGVAEEKQVPTDAQLLAVLGHICNPEHIKQEFEGFNFAWAGAIQYQRDNGNAELANTAINLEDRLGIIGRLFPSLLYLMSEDKN